MVTVHEEYLVNNKGDKKAVVIPFSEWKKILEAMEELDDIKAYDEVKSNPSDPMPFEDAVGQIRKES